MLSRKRKVLFVCVHNSARSVMAEAFVNHRFGEKFEAQSAGIEPGKLNPLVDEAMREIGIDVSNHQPRAVADVLAGGQKFDYAITVCDETSAERCPVFPGLTKRLHMGFPDPGSFDGTWEEKLDRTREVRDLIEQRVRELFASIN